MRQTVLRALFAGLPLVAAVMLVADDTPRVNIQDDCQPKTFNLAPPAGAGPGVCRLGFDGETSFAQFIQQVIKNHKAEEWKFDDPPETVSAGTTLSLRNEGGETHSFTRTANFGAGIVPPLNALLPPMMPAEGCFQPTTGATFVPSGTKNQIGPTFTAADKGKTIKFQCCIHPWMRAEIQVR